MNLQDYGNIIVNTEIWLLSNKHLALKFSHKHKPHKTLYIITYKIHIMLVVIVYTFTQDPSNASMTSLKQLLKENEMIIVSISLKQLLIRKLNYLFINFSKAIVSKKMRRSFY